MTKLFHFPQNIRVVRIAGGTYLRYICHVEKTPAKDKIHLTSYYCGSFYQVEAYSFTERSSSDHITDPSVVYAISFPPYIILLIRLVYVRYLPSVRDKP